jgi:hypothetical protein
MNTLFTCFIVDYLAEKVVGAVYIPGDRKETHHRQERKRMSGFGEFAQNFVRNAPGGMPAILVALVYVTRTKSRFLATSTTHDWGRHGVFLGALIVASKVCSRTILQNCQYSDRVFRSISAIPISELLLGFALQSYVASPRSLASGTWKQ